MDEEHESCNSDRCADEQDGADFRFCVDVELFVSIARRRHLEHWHDLVEHEPPAKSCEADGQPVVEAKDEHQHGNECHERSPVSVMDVEAAHVAELGPIKRFVKVYEFQSLVERGHYEAGNEQDELSSGHKTEMRFLVV